MAWHYLAGADVRGPVGESDLIALGLVALHRIKKNPPACGKVRAWMGVAAPASMLAIVVVILLVSR